MSDEPQPVVAPRRRKRLVKVFVQPVYIWDDGQPWVTEVPLEPAKEVRASEWAVYSGEVFPQELAAEQATLDGTG